MLLFNQKKTSDPVESVVQSAIDFADVHNFVEPEQTTYRLRHAMNQINSIEELRQANLYAEISHRTSMLPSKLRKRLLNHSEWHDWHRNNLQTIGSTKQIIKRSLRNPWQHHYDWLGQSLANSDILQNKHARRAYEQLAINYRIQQHLLNSADKSSSDKTTKNGYRIESVLPTADKVINKADRLIQHYYTPEITS